MTDKDLQRRGEEVRNVMFARNPTAGPASQSPIPSDIDDLITEYIFGGVWGRPGLDLRSRIFAVIGMCIALNRPDQLKTYFVTATKNGITREELNEVCLQAVAYCGAPAGVTSFRLLGEALG
jgi:4-carboxymuconolactone decarboxylase